MHFQTTLALTLAGFLATSPFSAFGAPVSTEVNSANIDAALAARGNQGVQLSPDGRLERRQGAGAGAGAGANAVLGVNGSPGEAGSVLDSGAFGDLDGAGAGA